MEEDEPSRESVDYLDFEFEDHNLTTQQLKGTFELIKMFYTKKYCCIITKNSMLSTKGRKQESKAW